MDHFGKTDDVCPNCGERAFTYGCGFRNNTAAMVATGKCRCCGFVPPPIEWNDEGDLRVEERGWLFLAEAYEAWRSK